MDSDTQQRQVHLFKPADEAPQKLPSLRQQVGELKIKCAASLCILLVLLIEALARRVEQSFSEPSFVVLNATNT